MFATMDAEAKHELTNEGLSRRAARLANEELAHYPRHDSSIHRETSAKSGSARSERGPLNSEELMNRSNFCEFKTLDGRMVPAKLKSPSMGIALKAVQRTADTQPTPSWPSDMQMMYPPPRHAHYLPEKRPPFMPANKDIATEYRESEKRDRIRRGELVYKRKGGITSWFTNQVTSGSHPIELSPYYQLKDEQERTLVFESRFESGNLDKAYKASDICYNLLLSTDKYTSRHTQWFYFKVSNVEAGRTYTFNITNLLKSDSLYNHGMQPCMYSEQAQRNDGIGWCRAGFDICYFKNDHRVLTAKGERFYYTLRFSWTARFDDDQVYFAHCYPYTYTDLQDYLTELLARPDSDSIVRLRTLCQTLAGNNCDLLTVTNYGVSQAEMASRKGVVISARVHPGETNASWMMKGFIDFITSNDPDAQTLRDHFVFKIVPMLNPDGVIIGNYRCSLAGVDLNRAYKHTLRDLYPTVFAMKSMMQRLQQDRPVVLYCDLHGHSRKHNVFVYGCNQKDNPDQLFVERVFPLMMSYNGPGHFSYKSSRFAVKRAKESTGRVVTWRMLDLANTFTMEATFCGSTLGPLAGLQFTTADFEQMGHIFFDTLLDYCDPNPAKRKLMLAQLRRDALRRMSVQAKLPPSEARLDMLSAMLAKEDDGASDGSDSSPSEGETELAEARYRFGPESLTDERSMEIARLKVQVIRSNDKLTRQPSAPVISTRKKKIKKKKRQSARAAPRRASAGPVVPTTTVASDGSDADDDADDDQQQQRKMRTRPRMRRASSVDSLRRKYDRLTNHGIPTFAHDRIQRRAQSRRERHTTSANSVYNLDIQTESSLTSDNDDDGVRRPGFSGTRIVGRSRLIHAIDAQTAAAANEASSQYDSPDSERSDQVIRQSSTTSVKSSNPLVEMAVSSSQIRQEMVSSAAADAEGGSEASQTSVGNTDPHRTSPTLKRLTLAHVDLSLQPSRAGRRTLRSQVPTTHKGERVLQTVGVPLRTMNLFDSFTQRHAESDDLRSNSAERVKEGLKRQLLSLETNETAAASAQTRADAC
eukprot:TRINITY_DN12248_c0_g1_i1.p1 TRINITY_DN12248_c0_g1~~TRINITY_DN12248_c0_g1_i1.p1  ORF type:complete len:1041 (+),score=140.24 TRINITY_DN12248_c0_g1_i1:85-3207(+)